MKTTVSLLAATAFAASAACASSCLSEEEAAFMSCGVERHEMIPGTPESDALRFYSSTQRNEYVEFNYDESKAGVLGRDYTLEDPLVFADGRRVTRATWPERRREILDLFEREVYGRLPRSRGRWPSRSRPRRCRRTDSPRSAATGSSSAPTRRGPRSTGS